ncbi:MAG TPA: LamG-like jellyroll fold domain-containing protein [Planctomycetota bacterium]|nr:LamG-like jellyroll fold domain-containing protein [Planctomycetota bacterium]
MRLVKCSLLLYASLLLCSTSLLAGDVMGQWSLDEGSGTSAADSSGNGNHGTLQNGATWAPGLIGNAISLSGTNSQHVLVPSSASLTPTLGWTLAAWVKTSGVAADQAIIERYNDQSGQSGYALRINEFGRLMTFVLIGTSHDNVQGTTVLQAGRWYHVAATFDAQTDELKCYVDGVLDGSATSTKSLPSSNAPLRIGGRGNDGNHSFKGLIDDARVFNRALSAAKIRALMPPIAPTAKDDSYSVAIDGTINVPASGVLANDTDINGDSLTATIVVSPTNGSLTFNTNGSFSYTPNGGFEGTDSFTYKANDGTADSNVATVYLFVGEIKTGLVGWWKFNDGSGTVAADSSGNGLSANLQNGPLFTTGIDGGGLRLDGADDLCVVPQNALHEPATGLTVSIWANVTSTRAGQFADLVRKATSVGYLLRWSQTDGYLQLRLDKSGNVLVVKDTQPNSAYLNAWHHYAGTYDAATGTGRLYVDGVLRATTVQASYGNLVHGADLKFLCTDQASPGIIDDARIYNRALSPEEIRGIYLLPRPQARDDSYTVNHNLPLNVNSTSGVIANDSNLSRGGTLAATKLTDPSNGSVVLNATGAFTYTPANGFFGSDSFTYKVSDGIYESAPATVTLTVHSPAPRVQSLSPAPGAILSAAPTAIIATFDRSIDAALLTPAACRLIHHGSDATFGTADDSTITALSAAITGVNEATFALPASLPEGGYRVQLISYGGDKALQFDGTNHFTTAGKWLTGSGNKVTVECWAKPSIGPGGNMILHKAFFNDMSFQWTYDSTVNEGRFSFSVPLDHGTHYQGPDMQPGKWYHFAGVYDGSLVMLYIDGQLKASVAWSGNINWDSSFTTSYVGGTNESGGWGGKYPGLLDEVRIWNVARTQQQIQDAMRVQLAGNESGLRAYYRFNEGSGQTAADISPNNTVLTLGGSTAVSGADPLWVDSDAPLLGRLASSDGVALDGEFSGTFPSGDGVPGGNFISTFSLNVQAPTVSSTVPASNATAVDNYAPVSITFSEAMNQASVQAAFSTTPPTTGTFQWSGLTMTYTPSAPLSDNALYTVNIANTATDNAGLAMAASYSFSFTTAAFAVIGPPLPAGNFKRLLHLGSSAADRITGYPTSGLSILWDNFQFAGKGPERFQQPSPGHSMNPRLSSTQNPMVWTDLSDADGVWGGIGGDYSAFYCIYIWAPSDRSAKLIVDHSYELRVWKDAEELPILFTQSPGVVSATFTLTSGWHRLLLKQRGSGGGDKLAARLTNPDSSDMTDLRYRVSDRMAPTVLSTTPVNGATGVQRWEEIQVTFSEAMDTSTSAGNVVTINGGSVTGTWAWTDPHILTFTPTGLWDPGATYTVSFISHGMFDLSGNQGAAPPISFTVTNTVSSPGAGALSLTTARAQSLQNLTFTGSSFSAGGVLHPPGAMPFGGHYYTYSNVMTSWHNAQSLLAAQNGHLATPTSASEDDFVWRFGGYTNNWIGLTDEQSEGTFVWSSGEPFSYTNWGPGEPSDWGGEDYGIYWWGFQWNDVPSEANAQRPYVGEFEKKAVPAIRFTKSGHGSIHATNVRLNSAGSVSFDVDFSGAASGAWDLVLTNPDGGACTRTSAITIDGIQPRIASMTPAPGSQSRTAHGSIVVNFTENISASSVSVSSVTLTRAGADHSFGTADDVVLNPALGVSGSTLTIDLSGIQQPTDDYRLRLSSSITDLIGNPLDGAANSSVSDYVATYSIVPPIPQVTGLTPAPLAKLEASPSSIVATFNSNLLSASVTATTFVLVSSGADGNFDTGDDVTIMPAGVSVNASEATLDLTGVALAPGDYRVVLRSRNAEGGLNGLAAYWKFDESSGMAAVDSTTNNNTGTLLNGPQRQAAQGISGSALSFDGVDDYVEVPASASLEPTSGITVSAWANITNSRTNSLADLVRKADHFSNGYVLRWSDAGKMEWWIVRGNQAVNPPTVRVTDTQSNSNYLNAWHHFAGTFDAATGVSCLYVDGVLRATQTGPAGNVEHSGKLWIMWTPIGSHAALPGLLDEVRIYGRALAAQEITELATVKGIRNTNGDYLDGEPNAAFPSGDGNAGGDYSATFTVLKPAARVMAMSPAPGSTVSSATSISVTFDKSMNAACFNAQSVLLKRAGVDNQFDTNDDVAIDPTGFTLNNKTLVVDLSGVVMRSDLYRVTLVSGQNGILDSDGLALDGEPNQTLPSGNGTKGGNFSAAFTVSNSTPQSLSFSMSTHWGVAKAITLVAIDVDNDPLQYIVTSQPQHGTLSGTPPNLTYTPAANFTGTDSFNFKANDGLGDGNIAIVSIAVTNSPPTASQQGVFTHSGVPPTILLQANDSDGDPLSYLVTSLPAHGSLSGTAPNLTYHPAQGFAGIDSFSFKVNDGVADSNSANIVILVQNQPPVADSQERTIAWGRPLSIHLNGGDVDGDPISFSVVQEPAHGTLSGKLPDLTYTPLGNFTGADSFSFKVNDGVADSEAATVSISVTNTKPTLQAAVTPIRVRPGDPVAYSAEGSDAEGDLLTFAWSFGDGQSASDPQTVHAYAAAGTYSVTATASDAAGGSASATFTVYVSEAPAVQFSTSDFVAFGGLPFSFDASASTDPENEALTYSWNFGDGTSPLNGPTVSHIFAQPGTYTVVLTVTDASGVSSQSTRIIEVLPEDQIGEFDGYIKYVTRFGTAEQKDSLSLETRIYLGDEKLAPGTGIAIEIAGRRFSGSVDTKGRVLSAKNVKWSLKKDAKQPEGTVQLKIKASKTSLYGGFSTLGIVGGNDPKAIIRKAVQVRLEMGTHTFQISVPSSFKFNTSKTQARGDGRYSVP